MQNTHLAHEWNFFRNVLSAKTKLADRCRSEPNSETSSVLVQCIKIRKIQAVSLVRWILHWCANIIWLSNKTACKSICCQLMQFNVWIYHVLTVVLQWGIVTVVVSHEGHDCANGGDLLLGCFVLHFLQPTACRCWRILTLLTHAYIQRKSTPGVRTGYCFNSKNKELVGQMMPSGSLASVIFRSLKNTTLIFSLSLSASCGSKVIEVLMLSRFWQANNAESNFFPVIQAFGFSFNSSTMIPFPLS